MIQCRRCHHEKEADDFPVDRALPRGRASMCRDCDGLDQMCRRYKIQVQFYLELLEAQGGVCAICGQPERMVIKRTGLVRRLSVDHDHVTGEVRGLLCGPCNQAVGQFRDDPTLCFKAGDYLLMHQPQSNREKVSQNFAQ